MVDSRGRRRMVQGTADFNERLASVEHKVDALAVSMDQHFDEVTAAILERRRYTDFAFEQLSTRVSGLEVKLEARTDSLETKVDSLQIQLTSFETKVESRFARLDRKLDQLIDRG
jgi:hypothetical protein